MLAHTCTVYPIRVWDVPYTYGPVCTYGAEHIQTHIQMNRVYCWCRISFAWIMIAVTLLR